MPSAPRDCATVSAKTGNDGNNQQQINKQTKESLLAPNQRWGRWHLSFFFSIINPSILFSPFLMSVLDYVGSVRKGLPLAASSGSGSHYQLPTPSIDAASHYLPSERICHPATASRDINYRLSASSIDAVSHYFPNERICHLATASRDSNYRLSTPSSDTVSHCFPNERICHLATISSDSSYRLPASSINAIYHTTFHGGVAAI